MSIREKVIGVIGGMGPHAGLDLCKKIFDSTRARSDHEHLPVALLSYPDRIVDRSTFLFNHTDENPAYAIADIARQLETAGATVAGMPCNTAHAPSIFDTVVEELTRTGHSIEMINMIDATVRFMKENMPDVGCVGTLSTLAVYELKLHRAPLEAAGFDVVLVETAELRLLLLVDVVVVAVAVLFYQPLLAICFGPTPSFWAAPSSRWPRSLKAWATFSSSIPPRFSLARSSRPPIPTKSALSPITTPRTSGKAHEGGSGGGGQGDSCVLTLTPSRERPARRRHA